MKKRKFMKGLGIGAAFTGMLFGAACRPQCVYGPPPETDPQGAAAESQPAETSAFEPGGTSVETVYGPPTEETAFDPANMEIEDVYGPPVEDEPETEAAQTEAFNPADMTAAPLYGPPPEEQTTD